MDYLPKTKMNPLKQRSFLAFLLFVCLSFTTFYAQAQNNEKVTVKVQNEKLEAVIGQLSRQAGVKFFYDQTIVNEAGRVSLDVNKVPLTEVLDNISKQTNLYFSQDKNTITVGKKHDGQRQARAAKNVKGVVLDQNGEPIIGASVLVKGTSNGIITNLDGEYTLTDVPEDGVIAISYIGYETIELKANSAQLAKVTLKEDSELLEEVVVVGYGVQKKRDVTTAIASIRASDIEGKPVSSMAEAMVGKMPGVQVSQGTVLPARRCKSRCAARVLSPQEPLRFMW